MKKYKRLIEEEPAKEPPHPDYIRKLASPERYQMEMKIECLDQTLPEDHEARIVWSFVNSLDVSCFVKRISSIEGGSGRASINPKVLVALWIYAISEGVTTASKIAKYCKENIAYKWICGNISVQRHVLAKFRSKNADLFEDLILQSVVLLLDRDLITLKQVAQDGTKIQASAAKSSMKRKKTLVDKCLELKRHIINLEKEQKSHDIDERIANKKKRELEETKRKMKRVLEAAKEIDKHKEHLNKNRENNKKKPLPTKETSKLRASTSDPQSRNMKFPGGSFHCAYNFQIVTEAQSELVLLANPSQSSSDTGQLLPIYERLKSTYKRGFESYLVDSAYLKPMDLKQLYNDNCLVYSPVKNGTGKMIKRKAFKKGKGSDAEREFVKRMESNEAQKVYNRRIRLSETINAFLKNRGLGRLMIRGLEKVKGFINLACLTYNMQIIKRKHAEVLSA
jgi:transposase